MGRKSVAAWPAGVDDNNGTIRIRFMWNGRRQSTTVDYPQTPQGIQAAGNLRAHLAQLAKLGVLTPEKYAELVPSASVPEDIHRPLFGDYAQDWLNAREIVQGTRKNYLWTFNTYWMGPLSGMRMEDITSPVLRRIVGAIEFPSASAKRVSLMRLSSVFKTAVLDGIIPRNPVESIEKPKVVKKEVDPFTLAEADRIIAHLYANLTDMTQGYACYFEFAFFTGLRPCEIMALRWSEVDLQQKTAFICRIVADRTIRERTKTNKTRIILLNERAIHALEKARELRTSRARRNMTFPDSPYVFPPAKSCEFIKDTSMVDRHFKTALKLAGVRDRPQYNCRHTYATMCLMAGMNPAFIAGQLGHGVKMLLDTYATWINSASDWNEVAKLEIKPAGLKLV